MSIEWNVRMRGTAGLQILDTPDRLRDTLIHEMCHAAAWLINNVSDGHGPYWTGWYYTRWHNTDLFLLSRDNLCYNFHTVILML